MGKPQKAPEQPTTVPHKPEVTPDTPNQPTVTPHTPEVNPGRDPQPSQTPPEAPPQKAGVWF